MRSLYYSLGVIIALFASLTENSLAASLEEFMVADNERIESHSIQEYTSLWWQWASAMPDDVSALQDTTGTYCGQAQQGQVWFLAGGYGSSKIHRHCTIPADKYIFFPVINMVAYPFEPKIHQAWDCVKAKKLAALNNDKLLKISVQLDDVKAFNPFHTRYKSKDCFDLYANVSQILRKEANYPAASDGYWVMLKPLARGKHHLSFTAQYDNPRHDYGKMYQDIEYDLVVN